MVQVDMEVEHFWIREKNIFITYENELNWLSYILLYLCDPVCVILSFTRVSLAFDPEPF